MRLAAALLAALAVAAMPAQAQTGDLVARDALRVCADPANLPFSNERREGFENRIAQLLGDALGLPVEYVFFPQVQGFVRNTLRAGRCDLVMGTVAGDDLMQNTNPYYHTAYVMVVRRGAEVPERLDDPRMRALRLGAIARTPPVDLLLRHGLMTNTRFFPLAVDTRVEAPGADMVRAVADGALDAALVWGPIAGYWIAKGKLPLVAVPLPGDPRTNLRMDYRISMGMRPNEPDWKHAVNRLIGEHQPQREALLRQVSEGVAPRLESPLVLETPSNQPPTLH